MNLTMAEEDETLLVDRLDIALRNADGEADFAAEIPSAVYCKERIQWAIYYDRLGFSEKARILYIRALRDLISVTEAADNNEDRSRRLQLLNSRTMERLASLEILLQEDIRRGETPALEHVLASLDKRVAMTVTPPAPRRQPQFADAAGESRRNNMMKSLNEAVVVPAALLGSGLRSFVQGRSATQFQSAFQRKASVRRVVLGSQLDVSSMGAPIRRLLIEREAKKKAEKPTAPFEYSLHRNCSEHAQMSTVLQDFRTGIVDGVYSPKERVQLVGAQLATFHVIVFSILFPLRTLDKNPLSANDTTLFINFLSQAMRASQSQETSLLHLAESQKAGQYGDMLVLEGLQVQLDRLADHNFYFREAFSSEDRYQQWFNEEKSRLQSLVVIYQPPPPEEIVVASPKSSGGGIWKMLGRATSSGNVLDSSSSAQKGSNAQTNKRRDTTASTSSTASSSSTAKFLASAPSFDYHVIYRFLAQLLWEWEWLKESKAKDQNEEEDEELPLETWYPKTVWVLKLFASRYGIGEVFQVLTHALILAPDCFGPFRKRGALRYYLAQLGRLMMDSPATIWETETLQSQVAWLRKEALGRLSKFKVRQISEDDMMAAIELITLTTKGWFGLSYSKQNLLSDLTSLVTAATERLCEGLRIITLATRPAVEPNLDFLDCTQLMAYTESLSEEVKVDKQAYVDIFPADLEYMKIIRDELIKRLVMELKMHKSALLSERVKEDAGATLDLLITLNGLMDSLNTDMHELLEKKSGLVAIFKGPVLGWVSKSRELLKGWIENAVKLDTWEPVAETEPYSSSVVDVFSMFSEILEYYRNFHRLEEEMPSTESVLRPLAEAFVASLEVFTDLVVAAGNRQISSLGKLSVDFTKRTGRMPSMKQLLRTARRSLPGHKAWKQLKMIKKAKNMTPGEARASTWTDWICLLCISINNCETTRMILQDILTQFENDNPTPSFRAPMLNLAMQPAFTSAKNKTDVLLDGAVYVLRKTSLNLLQRVIFSGFDIEKGYDLFEFLNEQLALFADTLYPQLLQRFLKKFTTFILDELEKWVQQQQQQQQQTVNEQKPEQFKASESDLQKLRESYSAFLISLQNFFHADGDGLPLTFLSPKIEALSAKERVDVVVQSLANPKLLRKL